MKQSKAKQLRDFIESHEMRYFVENSEYSGRTHIKKAFKVEINNAEYWVHFSYGRDHPSLIDEKVLLKTEEEAKAKAVKMRSEYQRRKRNEAAKEKARLADVTEFLNNFDWYDYKDWDSQEIKPEGQPLARAVRRAYNNMPSKEKNDYRTYIALLENYIEHGTIYTQAMSFRKEHVVSVKYGEDSSVEIKLTDGTSIIPKSKYVTNLIKTIFGDSDSVDTWIHNDVHYPIDKLDIIKEAKR